MSNDEMLRQLDQQEKEDELEKLRAWKESVMANTPDLHKVARLVGLKPGESITEKLIPAIEKLIARKDEAEAILKELAKREGLLADCAKVYINKQP